MSFNKSLLAIAVVSALTACGGGSSSSDSDGGNKEPVAVTTENLSDVITIQGATPVSFDTSALNLASTAGIASVDEVVVAANTSFSMKLSVPAVDGKSVAGYLIELPDGSKQFVRVGNSSAMVSAQSSMALQSRSTKKTDSVKRKANIAPVALMASAAETEGETTVVISGWNSSEFELDESLSDLVIRILPLFVNESVADVANLTFEQITSADGFEISMVQELALAVEAVATSTIQLSLTWDTQTDLDLYVLEPGYSYQDLDDDGIPSDPKVIAYYNFVSTSSLGWLDRDNTVAYGPENITFNYRMPEGDYQVAVNYFSGNEETNYTLTIAVAGEDTVTYTGVFAEDAANEGNIADNDGTDIRHVIKVTPSLNSQLSAPVPLSQYAGVWQLPEEASVQGYVKISADEMAFYSIEGDSCTSYAPLSVSNLPTGFKVDGDLMVSDAFFNDWEDNNYTYTYRTLLKVSDSATDNCLASDEYDDEEYAVEVVQ